MSNSDSVGVDLDVEPEVYQELDYRRWTCYPCRRTGTGKYADHACDKRFEKTG